MGFLRNGTGDRKRAELKENSFFQFLTNVVLTEFIPAGMNYDLLTVCSDVLFINRSTCCC